MSKSPILVVSDPHFNNFKQFSKTEEGGINSRLLLIEKAWREAVDRGAEAGCNTMICCGDMFHIRGYVRTTVASIAYRCLFYAMENDMDVALLVGNHDMENYKYGVSSIDIFHGLELNGRYVHVFKTKEQKEINEWAIAGIPYIHNTNEFKEQLCSIDANYPDVILIHQGIDDFRTSSNIPETHLTAQFIANETGISSALVLAGHYHNFNACGRVISPGALVQHNFGDAGSDRGCMIIEPSGKYRRVITTHPVFESYDVNSAKELKSIDVNGKFLSFKTKKQAIAKKIHTICSTQGVLGYAVHIEKEFTTAHEKTVKLSTPSKMLSEYIDMKEALHPHKDELLRLYLDICGT